MDKSDQDLVLDYVQGDERAFSALVERHMRTVYGLAYGITQSGADAEDITAETFLKAWKNIKKYKKEFTFKTWILTIARNTTLDFLRKRKHMVFSDFENESGENYFSESLTDEGAVSALEEFSLAENKTVVEKAMQELSVTYREILTLRYGEDMTFEEIASLTGKPLNTVKSQVRRGLLALKETISRENAAKMHQIKS